MATKLSTYDGVDRGCVRVLIVDDERDSAAVLGKLLQLRHYTTEVVTDATQVLEKIRAFCPNVALLDIAMPEVDGYEIARRIRGQSDFAELPIIAISGYGDREHRALSAKAGINQHLLKPVELAVIEEVIDYELSKRKLMP